jgi:hypothetical protein
MIQLILFGESQETPDTILSAAMKGQNEISVGTKKLRIAFPQ